LNAAARPAITPGRTTRPARHRPGPHGPAEAAVFTRPGLIALVPVLLAGCVSHGFDRAAIQNRLDDGSLQVTDEDIADARATRSQLRFPCRVAVYFKPADHGDWWWATEDRAALEPWAACLRQEGIAAEVFQVPE